MTFSLPVHPLASTLALTTVLLLAACSSSTEAVRKADTPAASTPATNTSTQQATSPAVAATVQPVDGDDFSHFAKWSDVQSFVDEMVRKHGFDRRALQATLDKTHFSDRAIQLMKPAPPGRPKNWVAYRARFVEPIRINAGVAFWKKYERELKRAEEKYGVPADIIVAIIGVETVYGRYTGNFRVMDAIATLAFAYPDTPNRAARMNYFRGELENTLLFARDEKIDPFSLLGSYAGAIGWPQFMPGSIRKYAVDFDGDGHIDLRNSPVDAIGSVAHFLVEHGWQRGQPIVFPAKVSNSNRGWERYLNQGLEAKFTLAEMKASGVTAMVTPPAEMRFGLVDLQNGDKPDEHWLGANNFYAITQYNRSFFYAMSVNDLSKAVRAARNR